MFVYLTFAFVAKGHAIDLRTASGVVQAGKVYFSWMGQAFGNLKTLSTNAIKMDWVPEGQNISSLDPTNYMKG